MPNSLGLVATKTATKPKSNSINDNSCIEHCSVISFNHLCLPIRDPRPDNHIIINDFQTLPSFAFNLQSFERVLVQNITHGLSPGLCDAIESVSRWKVVQAALPHVIHCCSSVLSERKLANPEAKFGPNETKLLYTLHWIILDAASECEDFDNEQNIQRSVHSYLHPLDTIQVSK